MRKFKKLLSIATAISISMPSTGYTAGTPPPAQRADALVQMTMADAVPVARDLSYDVVSTITQIDFSSVLSDIDFNTHGIVIKSTPGFGDLSTYDGKVYRFDLNRAETDDPARWSSEVSFSYAVRDIIDGLESAPATVTMNLPPLTRTSDGTISGKAYEPIQINFADYTSGVTQQFMIRNTNGPCDFRSCGTINGDPYSGPFSFTPSVAGTYTVAFRALGYFWESNESTVTINVADRAEPVAQNKTIRLPYGGSTDIELADLVSGEWDKIDENVNASYGQISLNGTVLSYQAPGKHDPIQAGDTIQFMAVDSVSGRVSDGRINVTFDAPASPNAQSFTVQGDRDKPVVIDLSQHISEGFFELSGASVQTWPSKGDLDINGNVLTYTYDDQGSTAADQVTFTYQSHDMHGNFSEVATVTIDIPAADIPTVADATFDISYGGSTTIDLASLITGDFDRVVVHPGTRGSMTVSGTTVTYTGPQKDQPYVFDDNFVFSVFTSSGYEVQGTVRINLETPAKPVATGFSLQTTRHQSVEFDLNDHVTAGFFDFEQAYISSVVNVGMINDLGNGRYRYTPALGVTDAETVVIEFEARDAYFASAPAKITIEIAPVKTVQVVGGALNGKVGQPFEHEIAVSGGVAPYSFTVLSALPDGLVLKDGKIEGTPTAEGTLPVIIQVIDNEGTIGSGLFNLTIAAGVAGEITLPDLALKGKVGEAFTQAFEARGGTEPYAYELVDALPAGLALIDNVVSGTPTKEGNFTFNLKATDTNGVIGTQAYTMTVSPADEVVEAPTAKIGTLVVEYGQSGSIDLSKLVTGQIDTYSLGVAPSKGTVTFAGSVASYTPNPGETGTDSFSYYATNAGGWATAAVAVTIKAPIGDVPVAKDHVVRLSPVQSGSIDLVTGSVSKDPIIAAHLISSVPASTGSAALAGTRLGFDPYKAFAGSITISYQLENRWGRSNVATVTFMVAERPDPTNDAEVVGLIKAQVDAAVKLADDQIDNIQRRIEQVRSEAAGKRQNSFDWTFGVVQDKPRYDQDGNELDTKTNQNVRGSFDTEDSVAYWTTGYVRVGETEIGGLDLKSTAFGGTAGVDVRFNENFVGGVALGLGREVTKIGSNGTENVTQSVSAALYGTWHNSGGAFVDGILGYSHVSMDSSRYVTPNGQMAFSSRGGDVVFGSLIGGYEFKSENGLKVAPYAGVRGMVGSLDGFSERGGDIYGLTYGKTDIRSLSAVAGLHFEKTFETEGFTITPTGKIEYRHELSDSSNTSLGYTDILSDVGMPYIVHLDPDQRDTVVGSIGVRVKPRDLDLSVEANVQANFNGNSKPSFTTSVRATWKRCGFGFDETACMSAEQKVAFYKGELFKAEKGKNAKKVAELRALLAKAVEDLVAWNKRSAELTPVPDFSFVDTISGSKVQKPRTAKKN